MKKYLSILLFYFVFFQRINAQTNEIHLSYNCLNSEQKVLKYYKEKSIHFYIGNEHFIANTKPKILKPKAIKFKLIDINQLIEISIRKKKEVIREGEKKRRIKILKNNEIFKTIFLYEKKGSLIYKYQVVWFDEIVD